MKSGFENENRSSELNESKQLERLKQLYINIRVDKAQKSTPTTMFCDSWGALISLTMLLEEHAED